MEPIYFSEVRVNGRRVLAVERLSLPASQDIIEEFIIDGTHTEWSIGSNVVVSVAGEMFLGKVTGSVPDPEPRRTRLRIYYRKTA